MRRQGLKILCISVMFVTQSVSAGDWTVTNSLNLNSYFSDNLRQRTDANAGMVLTVRPRIGLTGNGRRLKGSLAYSPTLYTAVGDDAPDTTLNHLLSANFNSTLVRDRVFLDSSASAGLVNTNSAANSTNSALANSADTRQVYTLSLSPYTRHRLGSAAVLSFRVGLNTVQSESGANSLNSDGRSASATLSSGPSFTRFPWSVSLSHNQTEYDNRTDTRNSLDSMLGYRIDRRWRLDGSLGYQENDLSSNRADVSGATYSIGLTWTPNPRTKAEGEIGRRYFGNFWRAHAEHLSRRTLFTLDARRDITNTRSQVLQQLTLGELAQSTDEQTAAIGQDFIDAGFDPGLLYPVPFQVAVNEDYLNTVLSAGVRVAGKRTTVTSRASWTERRYETSGNTEEILGFTLRGDRRMGGRINAHANMSWQDVDSTFSGASQYWQFGVGASRSLGRYSRLGLDFTRQQRTSSGTAAEFTEHRIGLTLTTRMF